MDEANWFQKVWIICKTWYEKFKIKQTERGTKKSRKENMI